MKDQIKTAMTNAIKSRDKVRAEALRLILSAIQYEEMAKNESELSDETIMLLVKKEISKKTEEKDNAVKANRPELCEALEQEISIMQEFLPTQLNREQLQTIIKNFIFQNEGTNLGVIMKELKASYAGQYDGKVASEVAKELLSEG